MHTHPSAITGTTDVYVHVPGSFPILSNIRFASTTSIKPRLLPTVYKYTPTKRHVMNNNYSTTYFGKITYLSQKLLLCKSTFSRSNYSNKDGPLRDLPYNKRRLPRNCSALIFLARDPLPSHSQGPENNEALKKSNSKPKSSCDWSNTKNNAVRFLFPTELNFCFNFFDFCSFGPSLVRSLTQKQTG
ncbi:unnamed protein product, partial [Ectocarpus sp. 8 AP-2014]